MFLSEWREFPSAPCLAGGKKNWMTARASILLKSRTSLICFRACFRPGQTKDLSAPGTAELPSSYSIILRKFLDLNTKCL